MTTAAMSALTLILSRGGDITTGDFDADVLLHRAIDRARDLAAETRRAFYVYVDTVFGLSVNDRAPWWPHVAVHPSGRTAFQPGRTRDQRRGF